MHPLVSKVCPIVDEEELRIPLLWLFCSFPQIPQIFPIKEDKICHRCSDCGVEMEEYSDEQIGIMITILNTFIHREPALAAPFLPEILIIVSK